MTHTYEAVASTALAAVIGIWIEGKGSTSGWTARSNRRPPYLPPAACGPNSRSSTTFAGSSTSSVLTKP